MISDEVFFPMQKTFNPFTRKRQKTDFAFSKMQAFK